MPIGNALFTGPSSGMNAVSVPRSPRDTEVQAHSRRDPQEYEHRREVADHIQRRVDAALRLHRPAFDR